MTTIEDIYAAINPMPAQLSAKGKVRPEVNFEVEANAKITISLKWHKFGGGDWDNEYEWLRGDTFDEVLAKAVKFIDELPSAEQARLHAFMGKLGGLIDAGRSEGIAVDYLNPLMDTMKRLSENVITYQPAAS
jgi:hypothetical protein